MDSPWVGGLIPEDDDDISQHEVMAPENNVTRGYQRAEDWHEENHNPTHVIDNLKREKLRWKQKFEGLGGNGI